MILSKAQRQAARKDIDYNLLPIVEAYQLLIDALDTIDILVMHIQDTRDTVRYAEDGSEESDLWFIGLSCETILKELGELDSE